jgi:hypothetical protein
MKVREYAHCAFACHDKMIGFKYKKDGERFEANPLTAPAMSVRLATAGACVGVFGECRCCSVV